MWLTDESKSFLHLLATDLLFEGPSLVSARELAAATCYPDKNWSLGKAAGWESKVLADTKDMTLNTGPGAQGQLTQSPRIPAAVRKAWPEFVANMLQLSINRGHRYSLSTTLQSTAGASRQPNALIPAICELVSVPLTICKQLQCIAMLLTYYT